ncbi:unnamed protein product [Rhodiola kirilowii]
MAFTGVLPSSPIHLRTSRRSFVRSVRCSSQTLPAQFDLKTYWKTLVGEINQKLDEAIQVRYPERIYESMRYSVLAKGAKRAPPVMCVAACELFGGDREAAFPTACALEMVHAASLIHDDLPCMDDDPSRRGQPSNHKVYAWTWLFLAGDALFPLGFKHIVSHTPISLVPEARLLRVITEIAQAVGSTAILAGASSEDVEKLRRYGRAVGMLYQVVDDVLETKNKWQCKWKFREKEERKELVAVYGVEKVWKWLQILRVKAKRALDGYEKSGDCVVPVTQFCGLCS